VCPLIIRPDTSADRIGGVLLLFLLPGGPSETVQRQLKHHDPTGMDSRKPGDAKHLQRYCLGGRGLAGCAIAARYRQQGPR